MIVDTALRLSYFTYVHQACFKVERRYDTGALGSVLLRFTFSFHVTSTRPDRQRTDSFRPTRRCSRDGTRELKCSKCLVQLLPTQEAFVSSSANRSTKYCATEQALGALPHLEIPGQSTQCTPLPLFASFRLTPTPFCSLAPSLYHFRLLAPTLFAPWLQAASAAGGGRGLWRAGRRTAGPRAQRAAREERNRRERETRARFSAASQAEGKFQYA